MDIMQVLIVVLLVMLFMVGLADVVIALNEFNSSPQGIAGRTSAEIRHITSEGEQAMDELSDQYLEQLFSHVTEPTQTTEAAMQEAERTDKTRR